MAENSEELERIIRSCQDLRPIGEKVVEISQEKESLLWYDEEEHKRKVNNTLIRMGIEKGWKEATEKGWNKGIKEGLKEGIKEGKKAGLKEGKKEGIKEGIKTGEKNKQIEIAKNLLASGVSIEIIEKSTGLSREEILNKIDNN